MKGKKLTAIAVGLLVLCLSLGVAAMCTMSSTAAGYATPEAAPSADTSAYEYMTELSDEIGPRVAGQSGEAQAAARITTWFEDLGYAPSAQEFSFSVEGASRASRNIIVLKPGTSDKRIVIGAHYDSVAVGRGAFDNASGIGLMMELADALKATKTPYTLVFVAFGAEEAGLKGSNAYFKSLTAQEKADIELMINFDSVATGDQVYCYSSKDQAWPQLAIRHMARLLGVTILTSPGLNKDYPYGTTGDWSDHAVFAKHGIPYLYFEATNWLLGKKDGYINSAKYGEIWHSKKDTVSYVEQRFPGRMEAQFEAESAALVEYLTSSSLR
jgi:alkaline phosphatase isozyme conversion protein